MTRQVVTFGEFARLSRAKGWTQGYMAARFRGRIESPTEFFHRVLDPRNVSCAIAYRSILQFYFEKIAPSAAALGRKTCQCGCGRPLFGRKKLASGACRMKMSRARSVTPKSGVQKDRETEGFSVTKYPDP